MTFKKVLFLFLFFSFLIAQNNTIDKTLKMGDLFTIKITLDQLDDILVLAEVDKSFFTNIGSFRNQDNVEFRLRSKKIGKTTIAIDNVSQNLENFLIYEVTIIGNGKDEKKKLQEKQAIEKKNPLLARQAYLETKEVISSKIWNLAREKLASFKNNFSDARDNYWDLVKTLYRNYLANNLNDEANNLLNDYLQDTNNFFLDEARIILAEEEIKKKNWEKALNLLLEITQKNKNYYAALLQKAKIYEAQGSRKSALNAYLSYLDVSDKNYNSSYLEELLPVLLKVGDAYEKPPENNFKKAYEFYQELLKKAQEESNFEFENQALNKIDFLEKHYIYLK